MKFLKYFLLLSLITFSACEKEDPTPPETPEVITTLTYTLSPTGGGEAVVFSFQDLDGDGGDEPIISNGTLAANQSYTGVISLLNEQADPTENITEEISEEDLDHQLFYESSLSNVTISYTDEDSEGNPLGLSTNLSTSDAGSGTLKITLKHEPEKSEEGVSNGDITNAGGETDIEVSFDINVE